jgi:hypothetical protein
MKKRPWQPPRNEDGKKRLIAEINAHLNALVRAEVRHMEAQIADANRKAASASAEEREEKMRFLGEARWRERSEKQWALEAAERYGELGWLRGLVARELGPEVAAYVNRPKRRRGQKYEKRQEHDAGMIFLPYEDIDLSRRLSCAIEDACRVRDYREQCLDGMRNGPFAGTTAEEIAAKRWGLTKDEVIRRRLKRGRT